MREVPGSIPGWPLLFLSFSIFFQCSIVTRPIPCFEVQCGTCFPFFLIDSNFMSNWQPSGSQRKNQQESTCAHSNWHSTPPPLLHLFCHSWAFGQAPCATTYLVVDVRVCHSFFKHRLYLLGGLNPTCSPTRKMLTGGGGTGRG